MGVRIKNQALKGNRWLGRQLNDIYVKQAHADGYRSRAAFKLLEIDEKFHLLKNASHVLDLGCAPGSWLQVLSEKSCSTIYGVDLLEIAPVPGVHFLQGDFTSSTVQSQLPNDFQLILSDMAPNTIGHKATDHLRIMAILEDVMNFSLTHLTIHGNLVMKIFQGEEFPSFTKRIKNMFHTVHIFKPKASRSESVEQYLICMNKS